MSLFMFVVENPIGLSLSRPEGHAVPLCLSNRAPAGARVGAV